MGSWFFKAQTVARPVFPQWPLPERLCEDRMSTVATFTAGMLAICLTLGVAAEKPPRRLEGLDRLYFDHLGGPGDTPAVDPSLAPDLGAALAPIDTQKKSEVFTLPVDDAKLVLVQVVDDSHPRIFEVWWALYDGGRRSDVWHFQAFPTRTDNKMLSNYAIDSVAAAGDGFELRVRGIMFRPQGAWWVTGKTFTFGASPEGFRLTRVRNDFGFFQGYDLGEAPPIDVATEREAAGRFEVRTYAGVPDKTLRRCGFRDPWLDEEWSFRWEELERVALCVTAVRGAKRTYRAVDAPSFIERGGR
jgi:hypothetical protein